MPNIHDLKESKYLTKNDIGEGVLATIRAYSQVNVAQEGQPAEMKWVLHFIELDKPLILNQTNGNIIAAITGSEDFDGWIGRKIVIYFDPYVSFGSKVTGGIRVRAPRNQAITPPAQTAPPGIQNLQPPQQVGQWEPPVLAPGDTPF